MSHALFDHHVPDQVGTNPCWSRACLQHGCSWCSRCWWWSKGGVVAPRPQLLHPRSLKSTTVPPQTPPRSCCNGRMAKLLAPIERPCQTQNPFPRVRCSAEIATLCRTGTWRLPPTPLMPVCCYCCCCCCCCPRRRPGLPSIALAAGAAVAVVVAASPLTFPPPLLSPLSQLLPW